MNHYLRPAVIVAFASGLMFGALGIAAAATFATDASAHLPACETITVDYATATP